MYFRAYTIIDFLADRLVFLNMVTYFDVVTMSTALYDIVNKDTLKYLLLEKWFPLQESERAFHVYFVYINTRLRNEQYLFWFAHFVVILNSHC